MSYWIKIKDMATFKETVEKARREYNRFKLDSKSVDALILELRNNPRDERKNTIKTILWHNVKRLSLDVVIGYFIDRPNALDNATDDYMQIAYFAFEKALNGYDIESPTQFNSYFKVTVKHSISEYHSQYSKKDSVVLPRHTDKVKNEWAKKQLDNLSVKSINSYLTEDGGLTIEKYLGVTDTDNVGLVDWNNIVRPMLLNEHPEKYVTMFEEYYSIGNSSGETFITLGEKYGVSHSQVNLITKKVLNSVKHLVHNNTDIEHVMLDLLT